VRKTRSDSTRDADDERKRFLDEAVSIHDAKRSKTAARRKSLKHKAFLARREGNLPRLTTLEV
jgi:hypothetical protein